MQQEGIPVSFITGKTGKGGRHIDSFKVSGVKHLQPKTISLEKGAVIDAVPDQRHIYFLLFTIVPDGDKIGRSHCPQFGPAEGCARFPAGLKAQGTVKIHGVQVSE